MEDKVLVPVIVGVALVFGAVSLFRRHRYNTRRKTLRRDDGGFYVWIDYDGSECRSRTHPEERGGAWYSESSGGGDSDGGGDGGD